MYVTPKGFRSNRPSNKLAQQLYGPYPIVATRGFSYQLQLPSYMKLHNVFSPDRLRKASPPLPGQEQPPEPPIEIDGEPE